MVRRPVVDYVGSCHDWLCVGVVLVVDAVTFLDYPDWRQGREEWATEHLLDRDDIAAFNAETEHGRLTPGELVDWWAAERAEAMAGYDPRDFGWWNDDSD